MADLVIKDFKFGIGPSPHQGFGDMRNLDFVTRPGIVRLNYKTVKETATLLTNIPLWIVRDPLEDNDYYTIDEDQVVYRSVNQGDTWTILTGNSSVGNGNGLAIWRDFLFVMGNSAIDIYGPLSGTPVWHNAWKAYQSNSFYHPALVSINDGNLYIGADNFIASVAFLGSGTFGATANPTSNNYATYTQEALDLPSEFNVQCLAELGEDLMIGTAYHNYEEVSEGIVVPNGVLFPWDRISPSFGTPLVFNENGIRQMINIDQTLYICAGQQGKYFKSNGVQYQQIAQLPNYLVKLDQDKRLEPEPGAAMQFNGKFFFGVSAGASANDIGGCGVWSIDPKTNVLAFEQQISTYLTGGDMGLTTNVRIGALFPATNQRMFIGWKDGATAGIDKTATGRYDGLKGYFDSPMYQVGTPLNKKQFTQLEFQLVEPLIAGQGVKIKFRTNLFDGFTDIGTYDFAMLGAVMSHNVVATIPACEFVQLQVLLNCSGSNDSPQLKSVTLR